MQPISRILAQPFVLQAHEHCGFDSYPTFHWTYSHYIGKNKLGTQESQARPMVEKNEKQKMEPHDPPLFHEINHVAFEPHLLA